MKKERGTQVSFVPFVLFVPGQIRLRRHKETPKQFCKRNIHLNFTFAEIRNSCKILASPFPSFFILFVLRTNKNYIIKLQMKKCQVLQWQAVKNSPTKTLAAGLSTPMAFRMVAPSLVTVTELSLPVLNRILSYKIQNLEYCLKTYCNY